jgi:hypothetical protein
MIDLRHSLNHLLIPLSRSYRYLPEEILSMLPRFLPPYWLYVDGTSIALPSCDAQWVACQAVSAYHNGVVTTVPPDDGFASDMAEREAQVRAHLENQSGSDTADSADYVTSDEDLVYEREFYL